MSNIPNFADGGTEQGCDVVEDLARMRSYHNPERLSEFMTYAKGTYPLRVAVDRRLREGESRVDGRLAVHWNTNCAFCNASPIIGTRYTSLTLKDYNMCEACAKRHGHLYQVMATDFAPGENTTVRLTNQQSSISDPLVRPNHGLFGATNLTPRVITSSYGYGSGGPALWSSAVQNTQ